MKLENTVTIPGSVDDAWRVLLDIERIAPCVPGATLTSRDGDRYQGKVKIKLGPIGLTYHGSVTFTSLDDAAKVAVMAATGREIRGGGTAKAVITCRLIENGGTTDVLVETDLAITGKPAQFGHGALAEVAGALIREFAANLEREISAGTEHEISAEPAGAGPVPDAPPKPIRVPEPGTEPGTEPPPRPAAEPIDLFRTTGRGALKRFAPLAVPGAALLLALLALRFAVRCRHRTR